MERFEHCKLDKKTLKRLNGNEALQNSFHACLKDANALKGSVPNAAVMCKVAEKFKKIEGKQFVVDNRKSLLQYVAEG